MLFTLIGTIYRRFKTPNENRDEVSGPDGMAGKIAKLFYSKHHCSMAWGCKIDLASILNNIEC